MSYSQPSKHCREEGERVELGRQYDQVDTWPMLVVKRPAVGVSMWRTKGKTSSVVDAGLLTVESS
jgi:hypothetical protein